MLSYKVEPDRDASGDVVSDDEERAETSKPPQGGYMGPGFEAAMSEYERQPLWDERHVLSPNRDRQRRPRFSENRDPNRPYGQGSGKSRGYGGVGQNTPPVPPDGGYPHPRYREWPGHMSEFDERAVALKFLIMYAKMEARRLARERVRKHLEADEEEERRRREIRRKEREILSTGGRDASRSRAAGRRGLPELSSEEEAEERRPKDARIGSFADFENSMFPYRSKNGVKSYVCPYQGCGMELPTLSRIKRHYIVHTKLKPFKCINKDCNKRFSRKDNMLQHYKIHCSYR